MEKSILLVAAPIYCNRGTSPYNSWPQFQTTTETGNDDQVQIMFLNCENQRFIVDHLKKVISDLSKLPHMEMANTVEFFKKVLKNIESGLVGPIYPNLRKHAEAIMGPDSCSEQQALYVRLSDMPIG